jgi:hypothetical protein
MKLNGLYFLAWVVLGAAFVVCYVRAVQLDERDYADFHLLHGPNDGCWECEDK